MTKHPPAVTVDGYLLSTTRIRDRFEGRSSSWPAPHNPTSTQVIVALCDALEEVERQLDATSNFLDRMGIEEEPADGPAERLERLLTADPRQVLALLKAGHADATEMLHFRVPVPLVAAVRTLLASWCSNERDVPEDHPLKAIEEMGSFYVVDVPDQVAEHFEEFVRDLEGAELVE